MTVQRTAWKTADSKARRATLSLAVAGVALMLSSAVATAEIRIGTDFAETLVGTNAGDHITGKGGNDALRGLAANDTYHFDDGLGQDTLTENAFVRVGGKRLPGGTDTLDFPRVSNATTILMVPEWDEQGFNRVVGPENASVDLGTSRVEKAVGGSFHDVLGGGSAKNTYKGGPGGSDSFFDFGGREADANFPAVAASDDTCKGFVSGTGHDRVVDYGGTTDKLDLRPLESSDVYFDAYDYDANGFDDSLTMVISDTTSVSALGHFSRIRYDRQTSGRIEQIIFSDEVVTSAAEARTLTSAPSDGKGLAAREEQPLHEVPDAGRLSATARPAE